MIYDVRLCDLSVQHGEFILLLVKNNKTINSKNMGLLMTA